jgi:hypothetical protein
MKLDGLKSRLSRAALLLSAAFALASSGCLIAAVGAGAAGAAAAGYAYWQGEVCEVYNSAFEDSWAATHTALGELGMQIVAERNDLTRGFMGARTTDGDQVRINMEMLPSKTPADGPLTRICVRVATFGDRPLSEQVLSQVGLHLVPPSVLGAAPAASNPGIAPAAATGPPPLAPTTPQATQTQTPPPPLLPAEPTPIRK